MKIIGRGWQYTTYDLGNGRVLKKFNTFLDAYLVMLRDAFFYIRFPVWDFPLYYFKSKKRALDSIKAMAESPLDKHIFGNPKILGGCKYEQDYVTPLSEYFKNSSPDQGQRTIDLFVEFVKTLASNSLIEKNFNVADNFGLNTSGNIILIDLGEICTDPEEIKKQILGRVWEAPDVLNGLPAGLRSYFVEKMNSAFKI